MVAVGESVKWHWDWSGFVHDDVFTAAEWQAISGARERAGKQGERQRDSAEKGGGRREKRFK